MVSAELLKSVMHLLLEALAALSSGPKHQHDPFHVQEHGMLKVPRTLTVQILQPLPLDMPAAEENTHTMEAKDLPALAHFPVNNRRWYYLCFSRRILLLLVLDRLTEAATHIDQSGPG